MNQVEDGNDSNPMAKWLISLSSFISLTAIVVIISIIVYQKKYKNFEVAMIIVLIFGDSLQSISILTPILTFWNKNPGDEYDKSTLCIVSGALRQLGILIEFAWAFNIALIAYHGKKQINQGLGRGIKIIACFIGIVYPISFTFIQYFLGQIGQTDNQINQSICFIQNKTTLFLTFVLPLMYVINLLSLVVIINSTLYYKILIHIHKQVGEQKAIMKQTILRIISYPMILILTQIWFLIFLIAQLIIDYDVRWYEYRIFCYCISNLAGLFDGIVYGLQVIYYEGKNQTKKGQISWSYTTFRRSFSTQNEMQQNQQNQQNQQDFRGSSDIRRLDQIHDLNIDLQPDQKTRTQSLLNKKTSYAID